MTIRMIHVPVAVMVQTPPSCVMLNFSRIPRYDALTWVQVSLECVVGTTRPMRPLIYVVILVAAERADLLGVGS